MGDQNMMGAFAGGQASGWHSGGDGAQKEDDALYGGFSSSAANPLNPLAGGGGGFGAPPGGGSGMDQYSYGGPGIQTGAGMPTAQAPPGTGVQRPPPSSLGWGVAGGATQTGSILKNMDSRPMTSNRASGYQARTQGGAGAGGFDPLNQGHMMGQALPLQKRSDNSPEEQCLEMEKKVNALIEESAMAALSKDYPLALEKAIEAGKKERWLCKEREKLGLGDQINIDLTYSVHFNLAVQYHNSQLYTEAINTYTLIVRNKQYAQSGRLRVNMGNIYYEQKKYTFAIKMYKTALDQVPPTGKELRLRITRNIANAYVKMGQYQDAINQYEVIMKEYPDMQTGFNLLLCYYVLRDKDKLKRHFLKLLQIRMGGSSADDDDEEEHEEKAENEVFVDDALLSELRERRKQHAHFVLMAGRLIAPIVETDWEKGFEFVVSSLKQARVTELKQSNTRLASELEMCWALQYLKHQKYNKAIECLKAFEKKDKVLKARAACNLSYLYFLEGDIENGEQYANMSIEADKYNAKALVNKGNFLYHKGDYDKAKEYYLEALSVEADCIEAIYNLGLATKALHQYEESLRVFKRLQTMIDSVEVIYQLANLYDLLGRHDMAAEWFRKTPTDPAILARLGSIYVKEEDESQAFHFHLEAYRYFPVNMDVINWLGAYFVKNEVYEKAMKYFERASQIQPAEVKWQLLVASCYRRIGAFPQAKKMYEDIHRKYPDNVECPRYLVHLCKEMGLTDEAVAYHKVLSKLEKRAGNFGTQPAAGNLQQAPSAAGLSAGLPDNTDPAAPAPHTSSRHAQKVAALESETTSDKDALTQQAEEKASKKKPVEDDDELDDDDLPGM
eukprot:TRINITY_DN14353_c0_g1_i1.p1 TRINITY_DN14353_c0_g1~~TRINITY_DN14353_c0_g1_i1.p1  ORF type:complete len:843 (+),score=407.02 TRINITY_DN14353_c0_g1_i1:52-2580(+)